MLAILTQNPSVHATLPAKEQLDAVEFLSCERIGKPSGNVDAIAGELSAFHSVIENLL